MSALRNIVSGEIDSIAAYGVNIPMIVAMVDVDVDVGWKPAHKRSPSRFISRMDSHTSLGHAFVQLQV